MRARRFGASGGDPEPRRTGDPEWRSASAFRDPGPPVPARSAPNRFPSRRRSRGVRWALAFALLVALAGCLRVGPGEDLHLVCEEKTGSPRKAYDVGFLVAQTRVEGELSDKERVAILEAARAHVITLGGRPHSGFRAELSQDGEMWRFLAFGERDGRPPDVYDVRLVRTNGGWSAPPPVTPPGSVLAPAWSAVNATEPTRALFGNASAIQAEWDPALPSCVTLFAEGRGVVVNVVQGRVVLLHR